MKWHIQLPSVEGKFLLLLYTVDNKDIVGLSFNFMYV